MTSYLQDLRFAFRTLGQRPGFTLVVVLTLGLGLGAITAVVDLVNLLAWRKLPVERPDELLKVFTSSHRGFVGPFYYTSYPDYTDYRDASRSFSGLAAEADLRLRLDTGEGANYASGAAISGNFFEVLGLGVHAGRPLNVEDDRQGSPPAMVIGHHLWRNMGRDPKVLGTTMTIEGQAFTVVGIAPAGFTTTIAGMRQDFLLPLAALPQVLGEQGTRYLEDRTRPQVYVTGRLAQGISSSAAQAELTVLAQQLDADHPLPVGATREITTRAATIVHPIDLHRMAPSLRLFAVAVVLLLVICCANVAHLLLARATARRREMGIRQSIGAGRWRLVRQLLTENLVLAGAGGLCGLMLAYWSRGFFLAFTGPEFVGEMRFDARVLGLSFIVCLLATLLFGLAPALTASRVDLVSALKGNAERLGGRRISAGQLLAAAQVALCVMLLAAGALLTQSLWQRLNADLGFDDEHLLIARVQLPADEYSRAEGQEFFRQFQERAEALPGVDRTGLAMLVPPILFDISVPFHLPEDPDSARSSRINIVDEGFFETLGIALEQGRMFDARDTDDAQQVVIVNRSLAEQLWPGQDPLGRTIRKPQQVPHEGIVDYTVVGVVSSVDQHRSSDGGEPVLYHPTIQRHRPNLQLILRSTGETAVVLDSLRSLLRQMDPGLALSQVRTGEVNRREAYAFERMQSLAVGVFAVLGLLLAALGIFGVLKLAVSRRVREVGIRMALGAQRRDVLRQIVGQGMRMALAGVALGLLGTLFSSRLIESLLFEVAPGDLRVLSAVVIAVLAAAGVAAYLPARRASRLDPLKALRHE